jgi:DNA modification methylase
MHPDIQKALGGGTDGCIVQGDCADLLADLPDARRNTKLVVVTDPPYGIGIAADGTVGPGGQKVELKDYGKQDWDTDRPDKAVFDQIQRVSRVAVIFGGNYFADILPPGKCWAIWDKQIPKGFTKAQCELAWTNSTTYTRLYSVLWHGMIREDHEHRWHPTQKPMRLMEMIIADFTKPGDIVLDPFCGSGTTCVAAKRVGRQYVGIEKQQKYVDIGRSRLMDAPKPLFPEGAIS